jgi:predicted GNAT family N-acyltransferase
MTVGSDELASMTSAKSSNQIVTFTRLGTCTPGSVGQVRFSIEMLFGTVAYVRGEPASGTLAFPIDDAVYLGWVATAKAHRGQGLAQLVIRKSLEDATAATGFKRTVLHATADGHPIYVRMGYRSVIDFPLYGLNGNEG